MLIGCCLNMIATKSDPIAINRFKDIATAGYDYVELPVSSIMELSEAEKIHLKDQLQAFGFKTPAACNLYPANISLMTCDYPHVVPDYLRKALDYLKPLGVDRLIFGSGDARRVPQNMDKEEAYDRLEDIVLIMDTIANEYDVRFIIETMRPQECNILNTMQETKQFLSHIKTEHIFMLADFYHMAHVNEGAQELEQYIDKIKHVHVSRVSSTGGREIPALPSKPEQALFNVLKKHKYSQLVSIESPSHDFINESREFIRQVKKI